MKIVLSLVVSVILSVASIAAEQDFLRNSVRGDLNRAKTYFSIITNLDSKQFAAAEAIFETIPSTYGQGGAYYKNITRCLHNHDYGEARDLCLRNIHFWIIDTAADWQLPALTTLLDDPDRLLFLQDLAAYCQKFPAQTEDGRESEALVSNILRKANERKKEQNQPNKAPEPTPTVVTPRAFARVTPSAGLAHL